MVIPHLEPGHHSSPQPALVTSLDPLPPIRSRDGATLLLRMIRPTDASALQRFHGRLSDRTIYLRFFSPLPAVAESQVPYTVQADGITHLALVALDPDQPNEVVAVAQYDRDPESDQAEFAIVVEDRWQRRGLGLPLLQRLIQAARARGIRSFHGFFLPENRAMRSLLSRLGLPFRLSWESGAERVDLDLLPSAPSEQTPPRSVVPQQGGRAA